MPLPPASAAPEGSIEGTVTDADGAGIKGIEVTAYEFDGVDGWTTVASTTTKNDGSYSLKKLPAAAYQVEFFDNDGTYVSEFYDDQPSIELADDVPVSQGENVAGIDAQLARTGVIRGIVTDEQGQPVPGIFIDTYTVDEEGFPTGTLNGAVTNDAGVYLVTGMPPGEYVVGFVDLDGNYVNEYYDDHLDFFDSDLVTVTPGGVTAGIDAELAPGGHISGTVTDSSGGSHPRHRDRRRPARRRPVVELRRRVRLPDRGRRHLRRRRAAGRHLAGRLLRPRGRLPGRVLRRPADV